MASYCILVCKKKLFSRFGLKIFKTKNKQIVMF